jgi:alkanesulfonate monooxygenase SsuD/methylene tetrahydromethanopterin reductase-like flavin-dependent oxidoreductase (luciferase family)
MASTLDAASGGRLELTIAAAVDDQADDVERYLGAMRDRLREAAVGVGPDPRAELDPDVSPPRLAVEVVGPATAALAARLADDAVIVLRPGRDLSTSLDTVRDACLQVGRPAGILGVAVELPVSVGRTTAEAHARAEAEALFQVTGSPAEVGVFGTLEQCQERVIALAHEGVTDLRCVIPNSPDIHDVMAQLTAITVGTTDVLTPGAPRSPDPDPPASWGGRSVIQPG